MLKFSREEPIRFKEKHPDAVIFLADESKNPQSFMGSWGRIKSQTAEDLEALLSRAETSKEMATNWGIRTGLFGFFGGDFEWSWVYRIWEAKLGERAETFTVQTPNGGKRPVFFTSEVERDWGEPFKNNLRVEFKNNGYVALGGYAKDILGNNSNYRVIKDFEIRTDNTIMQDTYDILTKILKKADFLKYKCIQTLDKKLRMGHEQRRALLTFMIRNGWPDVEIHNFYQDVHETEGKCDYKHSITQTQINSGRKYVEQGGKPHPCTPKKNKETGRQSTPLYEIFHFDPASCRGCKRKTQTPTAEGQDAEDYIRYRPCVKRRTLLAEAVWDGKTPPRYVISRPGETAFSYAREIDLGEKDDKGRRIVYRPPYNDHLTKGMVLIPMEPVESTFKEVIADAFGFCLNPQNYDTCGRDNQVKLIILIVMGSWFLDRMEPQTVIPIAGVGRYAPIIPIRGASESGKNRLANLLRFVAYHPFFDLSKTRVPSLFRPLDLWGGTLVVDEGDMKKTVATSEIIHFLNSRATGTPIGRQNPDSPADFQAFESFGLTVITQRQHFDDNATESRSVPFYSEKTMRKLPTVELDTVVEEGLRIQNKLLYLRLKHWFNFNIDKSRWHPDLTDHRLNASLLPVYALADIEPGLNIIIDDLVTSLEAAKKRIKAVSMDGRVVNYLWELLDEEEQLWDQHNGLYYVLKEKKLLKNEKTGAEVLSIKPLTVTAIKEAIGIYTSRKILDSLRITPDEAPARIRVGKRTVRPIWFEPFRFEKQLREFVPGYKPWTLYNHLGLEKPEVVTDVTDVTLPTPSGGFLDKITSNNLTKNEYKNEDGLTPDNLTPVQASQPSLVSQNDTVIDLSRDKQVAIVNAAAAFLSKMDGHKADHEFYLSFLMRKYPDMSKAALTALLWNHPDFTRVTAWTLRYTPKEAAPDA